MSPFGQLSCLAPAICHLSLLVSPIFFLYRHTQLSHERQRMLTVHVIFSLILFSPWILSLWWLKKGWLFLTVISPIPGTFFGKLLVFLLGIRDK